MTTPGGVPNLPVGALTLETLQSKLQDLTPTAMRQRAAERVPNIFDGSTAGNLLSDLSPGGIIAQLFAGFQSFVANADPADIQGPEDLPGLLLDFIESLPVVGQLVGLGEAIMGTYDGDDEVLLAIQEVFEPIRALLQVVGGVSGAELPTVEQILDGWAQLAAAIGNSIAKLRGLIDISWLTNEHQNLVSESGYDDPVTVVAGDDPSVAHDATDGVPGSSPLGCLKFTLDGSDHERGGELIAVGRGWHLEPESRVKWESVTATAAANAIRLELQPYSVVGAVASPVGGRVLVGAVASPSGSSGGTGGWGTTISGEYDVPDDGSVTHVALFPRVTSAGTAGFAKFDNTNLFATQDIPQEFIKDLLADLQSLLDWITAWVDNGLAALGIPPIGSLFDRINDLADGISEIQNSAEDAIAGLADKLGLDEWDDWIADTWTTAQTQANQIRDILAGLIVTPINSAVSAIKDWFTGLGGKVQHLTSGGTLPPANVGSPTGGTNIGQDILDTLNGLWAGLRGAGSATGKTATDVGAATAATADLITQVSSAAARLDAAVSQVIRGGGGGATDQFEREDTDLGTDWDSTNTGAGAIATNGSSAYWEPSGGSAATQIARNVNVETATNWQKVSFVLTEPLNTVSGWLALGRMNSAKTTYTYMFVKKDYREIGYVISGSATVLTSSTDPFDPPPGAKISGHFGVNFYGVVDEDYFSLGDYPGYGNSLNVTSTAPTKGDNYRNMGMGANVATASGAQVSPGAIELWTGGDSMSPPTVGVCLEADTPSGFTALSGSGPYFASGFFSVTRQSDWITFDATTMTVTVELPGEYQVFAQLELSGALASGNTMELLLISPSAHSERSMRAIAGMVSTQMSPVVYLEAGDSVRLAYTTAGAAAKSVVGSFRVAKLSPPYFA